MFDTFTPYLIGGILAGLVLFMLLFRFWNLPRKLKTYFKLNTRSKVAVFIVLAGFVVAIVVTMLVGILGVPEVPAQIIEGLGVGFSCAVLVGVLNSDAGQRDTGAKRPNRQPYADNKGRRSKG